MRVHRLVPGENAPQRLAADPRRLGEEALQQGLGQIACRPLRLFREILAQAAQINRVTIAKYEAGKVDPTMKSAERLANALGVTINDLIRREDDEAASDHRADS